MPFKKGQSGNPKGRPKKNRAWTAILERAGSKKIPGLGGKPTARKNLLAEYVMEAATTRKVNFADGTSLVVDSFKDWSALVQWIYTHLDGAAKQQIEHTGENGQPISVTVNTDDMVQARKELDEWRRERRQPRTDSGTAEG